MPRRDLARQRDVTLNHPIVFVGGREQAHGHAVVSYVDVTELVVGVWPLADRPREPGSCRDRSGSVVRACTVAEHTPILDAFGPLELFRAGLVSYAGLPIAEHSNRPTRERRGGADD